MRSAATTQLVVPNSLSAAQERYQKRVYSLVAQLQVRAKQQLRFAPAEAVKRVLFDEFMMPDHTALAKLQFQQRRDLQQCMHETMGTGPRGQRAICNTDMSDIADVETELWMLDELDKAPLRTKGDYDKLLQQLDSRENARLGRVSFKANKQRYQETKIFETITTRKAMLKLLENSYNEMPIKALSVGHLHNRTHYMDSWCHFCTEVLHVCWVRWICLLEMTQMMKRREENFMLAFLAYGRLRYKSYNQVEQSLSHVRRWHEDHANISLPVFPRVSARNRLGRREEAKKKKSGITRRRRGNMKNEILLPVCVFLHAIVADSAADMALRLVAASLLCIITAAFQLLFRIGELARGADYNPDIHWSRIWLAPLVRLLHDNDACVPQTQRKVVTEHSLEYMPILFQDDNPANFVKAYKAKVNLQPAAGAAGHDTLPGLQDAFALDFGGTSPDPDFVCAQLKKIFQMVHPTLTMDVSNHLFRRGGATCLSAMNMDPAIQEHAGGFARNSRSRPAYIAMVRETLVQAQRAMHRQRYTIIQDEVGYTLTTDQPQAAPPPPEVAAYRKQNKALLNRAASVLDTAVKPGRDKGAMTQDSDDDDDEIDRQVAARLNGELPFSDSDEEAENQKAIKSTKNKKAASPENQHRISSFFASQPEPSYAAAATPVVAGTPAAAAAATPAAAAAGQKRPKKKQRTATVPASAGAAPVDYVSRTLFSTHPWQHEESIKLFDMSPGPNVHVRAGLTPLCPTYNLGAWCNYSECKFAHSVCCFCRQSGHPAAKCGYGGKERVEEYKKGCAGPDK